MASSRALLRLAARDVRRSPGRNLVVVLMIALPVMAAVAIAVIAQTSRVSGTERVDRLLGRADAAITWDPTAVAQTDDPSIGVTPLNARPSRPPTVATILQILGPVTVQTSQQSGFLARSATGSTNITLEETDLRTGIAQGRWNLIHGRLPRMRGEAVISNDLVDQGSLLGSSLEINGRSLIVTGEIRSGSVRTPRAVVAFPGSVPLPPDANPVTYYVSGRSVTWAQVRELNAVGGVVTSREVLLHPPSLDQIPPEARVAATPFLSRTATVAVALVVTMALLEVVLLAGPAFAVTARRQSRALAMLSAAGATRRQRQGVVLGIGLVLGAAATAVGLVGGIVLARGLLPTVQPMTNTWFGSFQVPVPIVAVIAAFGLASALTAAFVPAWLAGRENVVLVLAGRRAERAPRARTPIVGLLLMSLGVASAVAASTSTTLDRAGYTPILLPLAALLTVIGAIFVTPLALGIVARFARHLPLPLRYAARDSVRHRLRTVPAVAAVAATAAGAITAGMAIASQDASTRASYIPTLPIGTAAVALTSPASAHEVQQVIVSTVPGATVVPIRGVTATPGSTQTLVEMTYAPGSPVSSGFSTTLGAQVVVATRIPDSIANVSSEARSIGDQVLARNGVVVFGTQDSHPTVTVTITRLDARGQRVSSAHRTFPSVTVRANGAPVVGVLSPRAAQRLGIHPVVTAIAITGASWDSRATQAVNTGLAKIKASTSLYIERGPQDSSRGRAIGWVILLLASLVAIVGTLTATSLSLSDARPDLATMSAVGASRRTRRAVGGSFALLIGGVGAILGVVIGLVPGIALAYRLTKSSIPTADGGLVATHHIVMPWPMTGVVLLLPVAMGLLVALTTRARLPIRARLD